MLNEPNIAKISKTLPEANTNEAFQMCLGRNYKILTFQP